MKNTSASQVKTFVLCKRKWYWEYVDGRRPPKSDAQARGSEVVRFRIQPRGEARPLYADVYDKTRNNLVEAKERFLHALTAAKERGMSDEAAWEEAVVAAETIYPPDLREP